MNVLKELEFQKLLDKLPNCFFVSVGANDGKQFDPLYDTVIKNKWSGVLIEPDTNAFEQLKINYKELPNLLFENSAITEVDGDIDLYCGKTNLHFTLSLNQAKYMFDVPPTAVKVPGITFKSLFTKHNISNVDVLMIDVEGYDFKLLKTFPFELVKPRVIRCEYTHIWNEGDNIESMVELLTNHGYECYVDENNTDVIAIQAKTTIFTDSKPRLRIYNPCNEETRNSNYNLFWDRMVNKLSQKFNIEEVREYTDKTRMYLRFEKGTGEMFLYDCDFAVENLDNGEFCILSMADVLHGNIIYEQHNPYLKKVLFAQYEHKHFTNNVAMENMHKYIPWIYFQADNVDLDFFYYKRKYNKTALKTKLYFRGQKRTRPILNHFVPNILTNFNKIEAESSYYFEELIQYKVALSIGGVGEFCYRDVEYMALGVPFIRFEYKNQMNTPLIPNVHYISIPIPDDLSLDRLGHKKHALMIEKRYLEVINDDAFLKYIATNARQYYETYLQYPNNLNNAIDLLGINDWSLA